jgi:hypothetical protein
MTWPTCTQCSQPYIPIQHTTGCPWCRDKPPPELLTESWRERRNRHRREATIQRRSNAETA